MNGTAYASWVSLGNVAIKWRIASAADYNGDGKPDFLWENTTTGIRGLLADEWDKLREQGELGLHIHKLAYCALNRRRIVA